MLLSPTSSLVLRTSSLTFSVIFGIRYQFVAARTCVAISRINDNELSPRPYCHMQGVIAMHTGPPSDNHISRQ